MFQGCRKNYFLFCFYFWFFLLFCKLLQKDLGELISVMECDPGRSMKTFHELCESQLCEGIGREIYREQWDKKWRNIYDAG